MDKAEKIVSDLLLKGQKLTKRFMALPFILKLLIAPFILILSFTIILPIIATAALLFKGVKTIVNAIILIYRTRIASLKLLKLIISFIVISIIFFVIFIFAVVLLFIVFHKMPVFVKWMILAMSGYMIALLYVLGKEMNNEIKDFIKSQNEIDLQEVKNIIAEASGENAKRNPLVWFLSGSNRLLFGGAFILSGGIAIILIFSAELNMLFPGVFFKLASQSNHFIINWLIFFGQELLKVIPIEFLSPFLPDVKTFDVIKPWGNVLIIFIQVGITLILYISVFTIYAVFKNKKPVELSSDENLKC